MAAPRSCDVCGAEMRALSDWLHRCPSCRFLASTLQPGAGTGIGGLEALRRENFERLLDRIETIRPLKGARLLEVGCAQGWFLEAAARRGADVTGIEPEAANARIATSAGFRVTEGFFPQDLTDRGPYDLIVFNDVFEHLPQPARQIGHVESLLARGGLAVINLPSSGGTFYRIASLLAVLSVEGPFERLWQKGFPSPHVSYFDPANLALLVEGRTALRRCASFPLRTISRRGLSERIARSHGGAIGAVMFAIVWALSFVLPALPADIVVSVFRRSA